MNQTVLRCSLPYAALKDAVASLGITRLLLVHDSALPMLPVSRWIDQMEYDGLPVTYFSDFKPNPEYGSVLSGIRAYRMGGCDGILAVGGGSAMDVAKCVKLWAKSDAPDPMKTQPQGNDIPLIVMPTTAGTGSEATRFAVIYRDGAKQSIEHESLLPGTVVLDPDNLTSLPGYQRCATMLDALCHGIESCWSVHSTEESRILSCQAVRGVMEALVPYLSNEARGNAAMQEAAYTAGQAINLTKTTAGHAMCYKLTSLEKLAHGHAAALCVSVLWPHMLAHMERCTDPRGSEWLQKGLNMLAVAMGCPDAKSAAHRLDAIVRALELPRPAAFPEEELDELVRSVNLQRLQNHPIPLTEDELRQLYKQIV